MVKCEIGGYILKANEMLEGLVLIIGRTSKSVRTPTRQHRVPKLNVRRFQITPIRGKTYNKIGKLIRENITWWSSHFIKTI